MLGIPLIIFFAICFICALLLQIHLSKKDNKRLGFSVPFIWFIFISSLGILYSIYASRYHYNSGSYTEVIRFLKTLLVLYFPSIVLYVIHYIIRKKNDIRIRNNNEIKKMNLHDL